MMVSPLTADQERLFRTLERRTSGEILTDATTRYLYSTDASYHLIVPAAVARPRTVEDLAELAAGLFEFNASREPEERVGLIMRSGGTSLAGGSIGRGLVVDVTKYFHDVLDFNPKARRVRVQPGVTYDELQATVARAGLMFPPNPASGIACELGGMWANNASGTRHVKYGPTRNWVQSISGVTARGERFKTGAVRATEHWPPIFADPVQQGWADTVWPLVRDHQETIRKHTPRTNKNSSGYALDRLWDGSMFDFTQVLVGSEGTLALFSEAELALAPILPARTVVLLFFESWEQAGAGVAEVLPLEPVAVEMVDRHLLTLARPRSQLIRDLVPEATEAALLVEFEAEATGSSEDQAAKAVARVTSGAAPLAFAHRLAREPRDQARLWEVRKSAAMIGHLAEGRRKPVPFIEDCVVRAEDLPAYIRAISKVFEKHKVHVAYWGHAGNGNIHVRPALDLTDPADLVLMRRITDEVFAIVDSFGGSYTAEHGDGYTHAHKLKAKFGPLYTLFERVKDTFDPLGYLNPDKIITQRADLLTADLQAGPETRLITDSENGIARDPVAVTHVENCVGLGVCKDFCPSFIGTRNEQDLTRGRTHAIRGMMTGAFGDPDLYLRTREFRELGDTCLNCKRCAHQCPSQVDEPRHLLLARRYVVQKDGMPFVDRLLSHYESLAPWGVRFAPLVNRLNKLSVVRRVLEAGLGLDHKRAFPDFASVTLDDWFAGRPHPATARRGDVLYFAGCFARYNQPESVGRNTVLLAERLGYRVSLPATRCSGHALETYGGDLGPWARHNLEKLAGEAPILTTCSSCRLSLVKQYPEWFESDPVWHEKALQVARRVVDASWFGAAHLPTDVTAVASAYHAPCHSLHLSETGHPGGEEALRRVTRYVDMKQSCSGMGGTMGFKRKHRTIAETNAELMMKHMDHVPSDLTVYTDCPSCRMALDERSQRHTDHPVNAIYKLASEISADRFVEPQFDSAPRA